MDDPRKDINYLNGFHQIQKVLAHYRTLTGTSVTIDPDSIYISDHETPVSSTLKIARMLEAQDKKIEEVRTLVKRLNQKIDRTREQLELGGTPWIEIRDIRDLLEELIPAATTKPATPQPKETTPSPEMKAHYFWKTTPKDCCYRCRGKNHQAKDCQAEPPRKPCPRCRGRHWMYDCPAKV